ncbi:MAG: hypothetical protein ACXAAT_06935 [Candidatus Hodarchaeales archaeon]
MWKKFRTNFPWIIFLFIGLFFIILGILDSLFGKLLDPVIWQEITDLGLTTITYANLIVRVLGYTMISFGVLIVAISVKSYRYKEKWAWVVFWIVPFFLLLVSMSVISAGGIVWIIEDMILILSVLAQILTFSNFFNESNK